MFHEKFQDSKSFLATHFFENKASLASHVVWEHEKIMCVHGTSQHRLILKATLALEMIIFIMKQNDTKGKPKKHTMLVTNTTFITSDNKTRISSSDLVADFPNFTAY